MDKVTKIGNFDDRLHYSRTSGATANSHIAFVAKALQVPMPVASLLRDRFLALLATGAGDLDWSALAALASRDAGEPSSLLAAK
jgi:hypothetical protein